MKLDKLDIQVMNENFTKEMLCMLDADNVNKIYEYLIADGVYYALDIFLAYLDLFLIPHEEFINKFEIIKSHLGSEYISKLEKDSSLIEMMYEI